MNSMRGYTLMGAIWISAVRLEAFVKESGVSAGYIITNVTKMFFHMAFSS